MEHLHKKQYRQNRRKALQGLFIGMLILAGGGGNLRPEAPVYSGFGITIPTGYTVIGVDMSHYQGRIFWHEVAAMRDKGRQISFVFIKATEGVAGRDKHFERNAAGATDEGLAAGAYHYFHPAQSAEAQAQNYLQTVRATGLQLRPALDIEVTEDVPPEALRDSICRWLAIVGQAYGEAPILYTGAAFYNTNLKGYFDDFPLWIAHYGVQKPGTQVDFQCWQFSDAGRVNGIGAAVDFNVVNGGPAALNRLLGRAGKFP